MKKLARQQYSYTNLSPQVADQLRELAVGIQQGLVTAATAMINSARLAKKAREILIESKKEEEFGDWVEQELGIDQRRIGTLINSLSYVDEFSGSDGSWDIGALELVGPRGRWLYLVYLTKSKRGWIEVIGSPSGSPSSALPRRARISSGRTE